MPQAYPLCWPEGWKRTSTVSRMHGRFNRKERSYRGPSVPGGQGYYYSTTKNLSVADGVSRILGELEKMGVDRQDVIISTNVRTRLDGMPRSGEREPDDPGAAVYWKDQAKPMRCMAVDQYYSVADNLAAIAATLEAMRAIERHGGAQILDRAFTGFAALPERASQPWRAVLDINIPDDSVTAEFIDQRFRELARVHHPDVGGDPAKFRELIAARDQAKAEVQQ